MIEGDNKVRFLSSVKSVCPHSARFGCRQRSLLNDLLVAGVVVRTLGDVLGVGAGPVDPGAGAVTEDLAQGTALLSWNSSDTEEELPAVEGMGVLGEGALGGPLGTHELLVLVDDDGVGGTVRDLTDPEAAVGDLVVGQTGRTLVPGQ